MSISLQMRMSIEQLEVFRVLFNPNGLELAANSSNGISLIDLATGDERSGGVGLGVWILSMDYNPDGTIIAGGTDGGEIILWDNASQQAIKRWLAHPFDEDYESGVALLKFSADGKFLVSGNGPTISVWDMTTGQLQRTLTSDSDYHIRLLTLACNYIIVERLINADLDALDDILEAAEGTDILTCYDLTTLTEQWRTFRQTTINSLVLIEGHQMFACGDNDGDLTLYHISSGQLIETYHEHDTAIGAITCNADGTYLVSSSGYGDNTINLWRVADWEVIATGSTSEIGIFGLAFAPKGNLFASATSEEIILWGVIEDDD